MSESDDDKRISDLVREHGQTVEKVAELEKGINSLSETLGIIASCMRIEKQQPVNAARVATYLSRLPKIGLRDDDVRAMLADYALATGKLASIRSQLAPFGFKF